MFTQGRGRRGNPYYPLPETTRPANVGIALLIEGLNGRLGPHNRPRGSLRCGRDTLCGLVRLGLARWWRLRQRPLGRLLPALFPRNLVIDQGEKDRASRQTSGYVLLFSQTDAFLLVHEEQQDCPDDEEHDQRDDAQSARAGQLSDYAEYGRP